MNKELLELLEKSKKAGELMSIKGDQGKGGNDGKTPVKGVDYFTNLEAAAFLKMATPKKGKDYFTFEDISDIRNQVTPKYGIDYFTAKDKADMASLWKPVKGRDYYDGASGKSGMNGLNGEKGITGPIPSHKWEGTKLYFENSDGSWDAGKDLSVKGAPGTGYTHGTKTEGQFTRSGVYNLREMKDVLITGTPTNGHVLAYSTSTGKWGPAAGGGGTWGSITGTLASQTDLQNALDLKANLASPVFSGAPSLPTGATAITQSAGNSSTALATTAFVTTALTSSLVTVGNANADFLVGNYSDIGAAINAAYASLPSLGGGIFVKAGSYTYSTPIVFGTNLKIASLYGSGSASTFLTFSPTTGNGITVNCGDPTAHLTFEISGICFMGSPSLIPAGVANTRTNVGLFLGGNQGCSGLHVLNCTINGFGTQIEIGSNAYMLAFTGCGISGGNGVAGTGTGLQGSLVHINTASNSGERTVFTMCNFTDPGNSIAANAIYFEQSGIATTFFNSCSFDNVQVRVLGSNGLIAFNSLHVENAAFATYGEYIPFRFDSAESNYVYFSGLMIADISGNSATNFDTIISHGVNLRIDGWHLENYGGQTVAFLADHRLNNGSSTEHIAGGSVTGGGLTNISVNWAYSKARAIGTHIKNSNSWPTGVVCNSNNTVDFKVGNNVNGLTLNEFGDVTMPRDLTAGRNFASIGTFDVGHATDTTLSRLSAGVLAIEGVAIPSISSTNTFTNKRISERVVVVTQSATPAINTDNADIAQITALAQAVTSMTSSLTGTPAAGDYLMVQITDNGTARAITWGAGFASTTVILPTTTAISTMLRVEFQRNNANTVWDCISVV